MKQAQIIRRVIPFLIFVLVFGFYYFSIATKAQAASLGLSLTPSILEANIRPGKTITQVFTFQNNSDQDQAFVARLIPFTPGDENGNPSLKPNLRPEWLKYFSFANADIELNKPFSLAPNQTTQLILTLTVPNKSLSTDIYATLLVSSIVKDNRGASSSLGAAIGSNLILTISPVSHPPSLVKISEFVPTKESYYFRYGDYYIADNLGSITFKSLAKNLGKYFSKTTGQIKIEQNGKLISTQTLIPNNVLSNSERIIEASPSGILTFKPSWNSLGTFLASIDLHSENSSSHAEINLLILPLKLGISLIISLVILVMVIKTLIKKNANHNR